MEERTADTIVKQMEAVRKEEASMKTWTDIEILDDIETVTGELLVDSLKYHKRTNKAAARRIRKYLLTLETLGKEFRKKSVK